MTKKDKIPTVAIQGFEGSFHQQAAQYYFGKKVDVKCCSTFKEVVASASAGKACSIALMAIENSIAGSILPNYNLIMQSNLSIIGEIYLQINQHLLVNDGTSLEAIREVHSHPMALQQCNGFLDKFNWKLVETEDTGLSAKLLSRHRSKHIAVIAGRLAADLYGLEIAQRNIHDVSNNYTRFLVLAHMEAADFSEGADKASISFRVKHTQGSLAKALSIIASHNISLSKLQSSPVPDTEWAYAFHADMEFASLGQFQSMVEELQTATSNLKIVGIYKKGKVYKK